MSSRYVSKARAQDIWSRLVDDDSPGISALEESLISTNQLKFFPFIEPYVFKEDSVFNFFYKTNNIVLYTLVMSYLAKGDVSKEFFELCFNSNIDTFVQFSIFNKKFPIDKVLGSDEFTLHQKREMIYVRHEEVYNFLVEGAKASGLGKIETVPLEMLFKVLNLDVRLLEETHVKRTIFSNILHNELLENGEKDND
jgi:hypothetical protein